MQRQHEVTACGSRDFRLMVMYALLATCATFLLIVDSVALDAERLGRVADPPPGPPPFGGGGGAGNTVLVTLAPLVPPPTYRPAAQPARAWPARVLCEGPGKWVRGKWTPDAEAESPNPKTVEVGPSSCEADAARRPAPRGTRVTLAGDSTMRRYFDSLLGVAGNCTTVRTGKRCKVTNYYGLVERPKWSPPRPHEGPDRVTGKGKSASVAPGCTECTECNPEEAVCENGVRLEYVPLEFARDVEHQVIGGETSQQALGIYLRKAEKSPHVLVVGSGFHDMELKPLRKTAEGAGPRMYGANVEFMLDQLVPTLRPGGRAVWVELNKNRALPRDNIYPQRRELATAFNAQARAAAQERSMDVLALWDMSGEAKMHDGNLHMKRAFNDAVATVLWNAVIAPEA